jgi:manganese/zinc/iron transport system permease protein
MMVIGALVNASCAVLGCFLLLRRLSLLGDAISHAVLPGLAIGFLLTGSRAMLPMFLGAVVAGVLTAMLSETVQRLGNVRQDAALGVVFTSLFALGVILITGAAEHVDLDPGCVLYGAIELLPLDTSTLLGFEAPVRFWSLLIVSVLVVAFVSMLWKELKIVSFDPALAAAMGINAALVHYLLMGMVAGATVAGFEAVGSILVVAMLVAPAAAAHLLTDRLWVMIVLAVGHGVLAAVLGTLSAVWWNTSVAGMMAVAVGVQFAACVLIAPRYGLVSRWGRRAALSLRIIAEDALALLYRLMELHTVRGLTAREVTAALGGGLTVRCAVRLLRLRGEVKASTGGLALTQRGERKARQLVRAHRLWETYLAEHLGLASDHVHEPAERMEHYVTPPLQQALAEGLRETKLDPHGQPIPEPEAP